MKNVKVKNMEMFKTIEGKRSLLVNNFYKVL